MNRKMLWFGPCLLALLSATPTTAASRPAPSRSLAPTIVGGQWTWVGGLDHSPQSERYGVYGTKGVPAPENAPGARHSFVSWTDASGNFWLFGGEGHGAAGDGRLNDLWKWDGAAWTWMSGSDSPNGNGVYGTKGIAAPGNVPGARSASVSWTDASGHLWLFGGIGHAANFLQGSLNDLWRWDGTNWTWVSGSSELDQLGIYGTKRVASPESVPGARMSSVSWTDASGNLWLFGGRTYLSSGSDFHLNDLWRWDGATWTWMSGSDGQDQPGTYGTKGIAGSDNVPGARQSSVSWIDASGSFWLFGGSGRSATGAGYLNDLWRWDGTAWTWVSGSNTTDQYGSYGTKGTGAPGNVPGARRGSVAWSDPAGNLCLFGGEGFAAEDSFDGGSLNDVWRWDGATWTWLSGSDYPGQKGTYGTKGVPAPANVPGARRGSVAWRDTTGSLWLFGGVGHTAIEFRNLNDLWKWDGTAWTWIGGPSGESNVGVFGTKGVPAPENLPRPRYSPVSGTDSSGNFWLFGGKAFSHPSSGDGIFNDLWRWDGTYWTWMSGTGKSGQAGVYGTKGVAAPENAPGARCFGVSWTGADGSFWLFGGYGSAAVGMGYLNDLWRWDGTNWTWVSGSDAPSPAGVYGTKGVPAPENVPPPRAHPVSWTDAAGNLWLFGGDLPAADGTTEARNDLWRWDGTNWTWISGTDQSYQYGVYGTKGVATPDNVPGTRSGSASWTDASGNLWLFGGNGLAAAESGRLNDLWKWDGTNWTWISGSDQSNRDGVYGTRGVAAQGNVPGARSSSLSWKDASGNLWLFGGEFFDGFFGGLFNDLWRWDGTSWTWISGSNTPYQSGTYGTLGVPAAGNVPGSRKLSASWADASGNLWLFGGMGLGQSPVDGYLAARLNDLWVFGTTCGSVAPPMAGNGGPYGTGATIRLTASSVAGATYLWTGPNGFSSTNQNPTIPNATLAMEGTYSVAMIVGGCAAAPSDTTVVVVPGQPLTVSKSGAGAGLVSSVPSGIDCGSDCSAWFPSDSPVTLTATAEAGSRFAGWSGAGCAGTEPCSVTVSGATSVSATFLPASGVGFHTLAPCRVVDTRGSAGPYGGPALEAGEARAFAIGGQCGVPADAAAVALNVTVTNPTAPGSLTVYPGTGLAPGASTIAFPAGKTRANNLTTGLVNGLLTVVDRQEAGTTHFIVDVCGYFR